MPIVPSGAVPADQVPFQLLPVIAAILMTVGLAAGLTPTAAEEPQPAETPQIGRKVEDFSLRTFRGAPWTLSDVADKPVVVLAFLGTECPLAKLYAPRLAALDAEYAPRNVAIVGINANVQDSVTEIAAYAERHQLGFPILKDVDNRLADDIGAQRTPEVVVLDRERTIRYHGRIDDQYLVGVSRDKPQRRDLAIAIDELLAGQPVSVPATEVTGCFIGRASRGAPSGNITYASHIAEILNRRCVECHRQGQIGPFALTSYDDLQGWEETILEVIDENRMPPWFANPSHGSFRNDVRLTAAEKQLLRQWIENGMPAGDLATAPPIPDFPEGWRMPEPDQVIYVREEPFDVPAQGIVDYQYFQVDPGWTEDKYIYATEARPGNRAVVHHIIAYLLRPGDKRRDWKRTMLVGYAPGTPPKVLQGGVAMHVPAGSKLLFEVHYTPNGSAQQDRSCIGLAYLEPDQVQHELKGRMALNTDFRIPPRADDYEVRAEYESPRDELLVNLSPHMHLRGKSFRYEAVYPNGDREILLDVPRYDFNWQLRYVLAEPKLLPKDTRIVCTAKFDNSPGNPVNPDPDKAVTWGEQSWEEMMIGFFDVIPQSSATEGDVPVEAESTESEGEKQSAVDPTGTWKWTRSTLGGTREETLTLTRKANSNVLSGTLQTGGRSVEIQNASMDGNRLLFQVVLPELGPDVTIDFDAILAGDQLDGVVKFRVESVGRAREVKWKATRE